MPSHTPEERIKNVLAPARLTRPNVLPEGPSILETTGFEVPELQMKQNLPPRTPGFSPTEEAIL